jgi:hypothetical protein
MSHLTSSILVSLAYHIPVLLAFLVGIILSLVRFNKHPQVSIMASIAFVLLMVTNISSAVTAYLPVMLNMRGMDYGQAATIHGILKIILTLINLVGWVLIISAIFGWRRARQAELQLSAEPV